jgi:hypothetical protein
MHVSPGFSKESRDFVFTLPIDPAYAARAQEEGHPEGWLFRRCV